MKRIAVVLAVTALLHSTAASAIEAINGQVRIYHTSSATSPIRVASLSGEIDLAAFTMTTAPWSFGGSMIVTDIELLGPGTYTRSGGDYSGSSTATVGPDQLGAFILYSNGSKTWPGFQVWDIVRDPGGFGTGALRIIDSDNDGIPGHKSWTGPYINLSFTYDIDTLTIDPAIAVTVAALDGDVQECTSTGGSTVTLMANVQTTGGAVFDEVFWTVDGSPAGTGTEITPFLELGSHTIEATAVATSGLVADATTTVVIEDTTPPTLAIQFIDAQTGQVITSIPGSTSMTAVEVSMQADDVCDTTPPPATGYANPVFEVQDGSLFGVQAGQGTVDMPVSAVSVTGQATDTSGNTVTGSAVLSINP